MFGEVRVHGVDETNIVHTLGSVREDIAYPLAALTKLVETKWRREQPILRVAQRFSIDNLRPLTFILLDVGLVVECIDLRRSTRHKQLNDMLGLCRKVRSLRCQRRGRLLCSLA